MKKLKQSLRAWKITGAILIVCLLLTGYANIETLKDLTREQRPNILFVISDDQSWAHAGVYGDKVVKTPTLDRLAAEGVAFSHSFVAAPSCTTSRTAVLAGQDMWRLQQSGVLTSTIPADMKLYPHLLADSGYHVGSTGKGWAPGKWDALGLKRRPTGASYNKRTNTELGPAHEVSPMDYSGNFNDFLDDRQKGEPFAFWFGAVEPHRLYQRGVGEKEGRLNPKDIKVPSFLPDTEEIRQDILDYYYEIEWYDTYLGSIVEKLEEIGELDNTLIIVTSDNGMPFPRAKATLYDWGTRVPLVIRWGSKIKNPGRWVKDFVSHTDFAPTILDAAGIEIPLEMTGRSLLPILSSEKEGIVEPQRDNVVYGIERHTICRREGAGYPSRAIRTEEFLYIRNYKPDRWPAGDPDFLGTNKVPYGDIDPGFVRDFVLRDDFAKTYPKHAQRILGKRPAVELYKIADDPGQINNLADDQRYAAIKEELEKRMNAQLDETGDPRRMGKEPWQDYIYHQYNGYGSSFNTTLSESERRRALLLPGYYKNYPVE